MTYTKSFPKEVNKPAYTKWEEIELSVDEEKEVEELARKRNLAILDRCIKDAKLLIKNNKLKNYQTDIINIARTLFDKQSINTIFLKEEKARKKFKN